MNQGTLIGMSQNSGMNTLANNSRFVLRNRFRDLKIPIKMEVLGKYPAGLLAGFVIGFTIIHPFSMMFKGLFLPMINFNLKSLLYAFHPEHLPMAFFFGLLGILLGTLNVYYLKTITKNKIRIKFLEGLLPICSYCKKIRDDSGKSHGEGDWESIEGYIYKKTEQEFTHGICPECVETAFPHANKN